MILPGRWEEIKDAIEGRVDEYKNGQGKEKAQLKQEATITCVI